MGIHAQEGLLVAGVHVLHGPVFGGVDELAIQAKSSEQMLVAGCGMVAHVIADTTKRTNRNNAFSLQLVFILSLSFSLSQRDFFSSVCVFKGLEGS